MAVVSMSKQEFNRLEILLRVRSGGLRISDACALIGVRRRQVFRLLRGLGQDGAASLVSKHRGKPSNHRLPAEVRGLALSVVRERVAFWAVLAEDQGRRVELRLPTGTREVKVEPDELAAAVDALLENVFAHTPRWQGFGLVLLEAMLAGLPVVATRASAIPEIVVDGETGLLADPGDAAGVAAALDALLADPTRRRALGEAGRRRAREEFSVSRMTDRTLAVYERILRR